MTEDQADIVILGCCCILLGISGLLQIRMIKRHDEMLERHEGDITFLRVVSREMEKRLADD